MGGIADINALNPDQNCDDCGLASKVTIEKCGNDISMANLIQMILTMRFKFMLLAVIVRLNQPEEVMFKSFYSHLQVIYEAMQQVMQQVMFKSCC